MAPKANGKDAKNQDKGQPSSKPGANGNKANGHQPQQPGHKPGGGKGGASPGDKGQPSCKPGANGNKSNGQTPQPQNLQPGAGGSGGSKPGPKPCKFGMGCTRSDCYFSHPEGWNAGQAGHMAYIMSKACGTGLYSKISGLESKEDDRSREFPHEILFVKDGGHSYMKTLVPYDKSMQLKKRLDNIVDTFRSQIEEEVVEVDVVGSTRLVAGKGGQVSTILVGQDCLSVRVSGVPLEKGTNKEENEGAVRVWLSNFGEVTTQRFLSANKEDKGTFLFRFESPKAATEAIEKAARTSEKPFGCLWPHIQTGKDFNAIMTMVPKVKISYPYNGPNGTDTRLLVCDLLKRWHVKVQDVADLTVKDKGGKQYGVATVRMRSLEDCMSAATYDGQMYSKLSPKEPLVVRSKAGLQVTLQQRVFNAVWEGVYKEKRAVERDFPPVVVDIKPPKTGCRPRPYGVIRIRPLPSYTFEAVKDALREACKRIEAAMSPLYFPLDWKQPGYLTTWQGKRNLTQAADHECGDVPRAADASHDKPNRRGLAFVVDNLGSCVKVYATASDLKKEGVQTVEVIRASLAEMQIREYPLSDVVIQYLANQNTQHLLQRMKQDAGVPRLDFQANAKLIRVTAPYHDLRRADVVVKWLKQEAAAGGVVTVVEQSPAGRTCAVCFCEISQDDMHITEPCGHAYCQTCISSYVNNQRFPVKCLVPKCGKAVSLEDIKRCSASAEAYGQSIYLALNDYIGKNATRFAPCYTAGCKQVIKMDGHARFECDRCLQAFCKKCNTTWHDGKTCEQWQAHVAANNASEAWVKANTRPCGNCKAPFLKDGGCNRLQCGQCGKMICNLCNKTFNTSTEAYNHLSQVHGGFWTNA